MCFLPRFRNNQASPASSYKQTDISTEDKEEPLKVTLECPKLNLTDTNRTCVRTRFTCQNDNDCDSLEKCCEYKCGKKCIGLGSLFKKWNILTFKDKFFSEKLIYLKMEGLKDF